MKQIRVDQRGRRRRRPSPEILPLDPRDLDLVRAKALRRTATLAARTGKG
jgi:hypothetical protein